MHRKLFLGMLLCLLFPGLALRAQTTSIRGTVVDESQALIPGVTVQLEHLDYGERKTVVSDDAGRFIFVGVRPGNVRITASLPGFQTWSQQLRLGSTELHLPVVLKVANVSTTIEVSASVGNLLSVSGATVGQVVGTRSGTNQVARPDVYRGRTPMNTESYDYLEENQFTRVAAEPRSTFGVDVDTAAYANVRRFLNSGDLPPKDAVRIEELVNYFKYEYRPPAGAHPVAIHAEVATPFWEPMNRLVRIGVRAKDIDISGRSKANLVFLIDVSGSMMDPAKLPLVQSSLHLLVDQLRADDTVTMVVYAGSSGLVLRPTPGSKKDEIHEAIERLSAGGSTNGGAGIQLAYRMATEHFIPGGINRVILATDGDFNVGVTNEGALVRLIEQQAQSGVFLTVLGFGIGNYKDSTLEKLADKGNGNYAYIDTISEARRALVEQLSGTLQTIAKDVKLQIEFNPAEVEAYRLLGYENRRLADADFANDKKDAGDMGAGHSVTAFFEIVPRGITFEGPDSGPLRYQKPPELQQAPKGELLTVSLRYKLPEDNRSVLLEVPVKNASTAFERASPDFRFASSVAAFGMILRDSPYRGTATIEDVVKTGSDARGKDPARAEFVSLARKAATELEKR